MLNGKDLFDLCAKEPVRNLVVFCLVKRSERLHFKRIEAKPRSEETSRKLRFGDGAVVEAIIVLEETKDVHSVLVDI